MAQEKFDVNEIVLLGTNLQPNEKDMMSDNLELYPFTKQRHVKTLIKPIIKKRLAENFENLKHHCQKAQHNKIFVQCEQSHVCT